MSSMQEQKETIISYFLLTLINFYGIYDAFKAYALVCAEVADIKEKTFVKIVNKLAEDTGMIQLINYDTMLNGAELVSGMLFDNEGMNINFYNSIKQEREKYNQYDFLNLKNDQFLKYVKFDYYEKTTDLKNLRDFLKNEYHADMKKINILLNNIFIYHKMFGLKLIIVNGYVEDICRFGKIKLEEDDYKILYQYLIRIFEHQRSWSYYGNRKKELDNFISFDHPLIFDVLTDLRHQALSFTKYEKRIQNGYYGDDEEHLEDLLYQVAIIFQNMNRFIDKEDELLNNKYVN